MNSKTRPILALILVQILFGINFISSKVVLAGIPPLIWAAIRVSLAAIGLVLAAVLLKKPKIALNRKTLPPLFTFSFLGVIVSNAAFLAGLYRTTATNGSILTTTVPMFTLLAAVGMSAEKLTRKKLLGFIAALSGVLILRGVENFSLSDQTLIGDALMLLNALVSGLYLALSKDFVETHDPLWTTAWTFVIGGVVLTILSIPSWSEFQMPELTPAFLLCFFYSIIGATMITFFLNIWTLTRLQASSVALFMYLQPVVAFIMAWMLFNEQITARALGSGALIFVGMVLGLR